MEFIHSIEQGGGWRVIPCDEGFEKRKEGIYNMVEMLLNTIEN
jgi:hypothetical protein